MLIKEASRLEETERGFKAEPSDDIELSIVMPCLNEAETLRTCLRKAFRFLRTFSVRGEVIVGDNGSVDGSQRIALEEGARLVDVQVKGYGAALYFSSSAARGKYILMADSDDSYDLSDLGPFLARLREGDDLVMGNRFAGGIKPGAMPWKNRYIGNPVLSGIGSTLFRSPVRDFHCGLRAFSRTAFEKMDLRTTGMEFASEMVIKASLLKLRISQVPTMLSPDGRSRSPHLRPWRDGWRHLRFMLLYSPNWLFLYPGLLLMTLAATFGGVLVQGPATIGGIEFAEDSLIYLAFFVIIGFQGVLFSFLSRVYAMHARLYPPTESLLTALRHLTLERGLAVGGMLAAGGMGLGIYAVAEWQQHAFGPMNFAHLAKLAIPSATAMTIGVELILFSLFFSTLQLSLRHMPPCEATTGTSQLQLTTIARTEAPAVSSWKDEREIRAAS